MNRLVVSVLPLVDATLIKKQMREAHFSLSSLTCVLLSVTYVEILSISILLLYYYVWILEGNIFTLYI